MADTKPADTKAAAHPQGLSMIEKRRIEAEILKHVYDELTASQGVEVAKRTIGEAVRRSAVEQAERFAAQSPEGTSLQAFIDMQALWTQGGALEIEVVGQTPDTYSFNVTRCRYSEMYKDMGLGEIGHLLSCQRDGTFCEGYDKKLKLDRSQTIMQGASHCDFRFRYEGNKPG
ncbi:MAG: L-2-amino-thiazoline-4-carboxylic acid hydrolase [Rhizobiales bacterium]|nr:L-2-amino-thiazoline-4-carboxylic acid hydrolase [Hyphomicrobiales bacterium]